MKEEKTHSFELDDVRKYGSIEKALLMKEFRRMSIYKLNNGRESWVYYSSGALEKKFDYMAKSSIRRWLDELVEEKHLLRTVRNKMKYDKTYSYTPIELANEKPNWESVAQNEPSMAQNEPTIPPLSNPLSLTSETSVSHEDDVTRVPVDDWGEEFTPKWGKKDTSYREVFELFGAYPKSWERNTTQIKAAKALKKEKDWEQVKKAIKFYLDNSDKPFIPNVSTPYELDQKWEKLLEYKYRDRR